MSFTDCIDEAVKANKLSEKKADNIRGRAESLAEVYRAQGTMGENELQTKAQLLAIQSVIAKTKFHADREAKKVLAQHKIVQDMKTHPAGPHWALLHAWADRMKGRESLVESTPIETAAQVFEGKMGTQMPTFNRLFAARANGEAGNTALQDLLVHAVDGENIEHADVMKAKGEVTNVLEQINTAARNVGLDIGKLEHYFPHYWDVLELMKIDKDVKNAASKFEADVSPRLKPGSIKDINGNPESDAEISRLLKEEIYPNMITQGDYKASEELARREGLIAKRKKVPLKPVTEEAVLNQADEALFGKRALSDQRHRVLHFKAKDWLELNAKYGGMSPVKSFQHYVHRMAMDIAIADKFGPDVHKTFPELLALAYTMNPKPKLLEKDPQTLYEYFTGRGMTAKNMRAIKIDRVFHGMRNLTGLRMLATAPLTAINDLSQLFVVARGLRTSYFGTFGLHMQLLFKHQDLTEMAQMIGVGLKDIQANAGSRFNEMANNYRSGWTDRAIRRTLTAGGLIKWSNSLQTAVALKTNIKMAADAFSPYSALSDAEKSIYAKFGLHEGNWSELKEAVTKTKEGRVFIDPAKLSVKDDPYLQTKVSSIAHYGYSRVIPHNDAFVNTFLNAHKFKGMFGGEFFLRNPLQYLHYSIGSIDRFIDDLMHAPINAGIQGKTATIVGYSMVALFTGALSVQLKHLEHGENLDDMKGFEFYLHSMVEGLNGIGIGLGQFEDMSSNELTNMTMKLGGPSGVIIAALTELVNDAGVQPVKSTLYGKPYKGKPGKHIVQAIESIFPTTWWSQLIMRRIFFDMMQKFLDPHAGKDFARERKKKDEWWESGDFLPKFLQ